MANKRSGDLFLRLSIWAVLFFAAFASTADAGAGDLQHQLAWLAGGSGPGGCRGTIAECLAAGDVDGDGEEFQLSSEISRRILATSHYISYGALSRNRVPCSYRGASYYNCRPSARANPYTRGCSRITRCRR